MLSEHICNLIVLLTLHGVGTYYGQWSSGLRHGFGVRQSAPFKAATPIRHDVDQQQQQGATQRRRPRHHRSMPVLNSLSPTDGSTSTSPVGGTAAAAAPVYERGRSGFVLTGDRDASRRTPRSRSSSLRRMITDGVSSVTHPKRRKPDAMAGATTPQVSLSAAAPSRP